MPPTKIPKTSIYEKKDFIVNLLGECILLKVKIKILRFGGTNNPSFAYEILEWSFAKEHTFVSRLYRNLSVKHKPIIEQLILESIDAETRESIFPFFYHGTIQEPITD